MFWELRGERWGFAAGISRPVRTVYHRRGYVRGLSKILYGWPVPWDDAPRGLQEKMMRVHQWQTSLFWQRTARDSRWSAGNFQIRNAAHVLGYPVSEYVYRSTSMSYWCPFNKIQVSEWTKWMGWLNKIIEKEWISLKGHGSIPAYSILVVSRSGTSEQKTHLRSGFRPRELGGRGFEEVAKRDISPPSPRLFPCGSAHLICSIPETKKRGVKSADNWSVARKKGCCTYFTAYITSLMVALGFAWRRLIIAWRKLSVG